MPINNSKLALAASAAVLALGGVAAGCGGSDGGGSGSGDSGDGAQSGKIALLLPENKTARYEAADRPYFTDKVKADCPDCEVLYSNAAQDPAKQQQQAEAAITNGAQVLVLDAVDAASAASIVTRAAQADIPVVSYDRLVLEAEGIDAYVSFDNEKIGELQAQSLLDELGEPQGKSIVMINGAPTDNNAKLFKQGAHNVFDPSGIDVAKEYDTPDWSPDKAQQEMEQAITAVGKDNIDGVYAANDGNAGGAIAAMKSAGIDPMKVPVTGQDSELAGVQRVIAGEQYMTIYKPIKPQAELSADIAIKLLRGEDIASMVPDSTNNGAEDVPSKLFDATAITKDKVNDTIVKDGFLETSELCSGDYAAACESAGISAAQ